MKNLFLLSLLLFYSTLSGAQIMFPAHEGLQPGNGKMMILRDTDQVFQPFAMRTRAGADEFRVLPDGTRQYVTTHFYKSGDKDSGRKIPLPAATVHIVFSWAPAAFFLSSDDITYTMYDLNWVSGNTATMEVSPGTYDYIAYSGSANRVLVKSGIQVTEQGATLHVDFNEAGNLVTFKGFDENGTLLSQVQGYKIASCNVRFPLSRDMDYYTVLMTSGGTMRINDFSGGFSLLGGYYCQDISGTHKVYFPQFQAVTAIDTSITVTNNPQDYVSENLEFHWKSGASTPNLLIWNCIKNLRDYGWFYFAFGQQAAFDSTRWTGKLFLTPDITGDIGYTTGFSILNTAELMPSWDETGFFKVVGDGMCNNFVTDPGMYIYPPGSTMTFGAGCASFRNIFVNNRDGGSTIRSYHDIYGINRDPRYEYYYDSWYQLYDDPGNLIGSGPYMNLTTGSYPAGRYVVKVVNNECYFADSAGSHQVVTSFDLRQPDPDPPQLTSFQVRNSASVPCYKLHVNEEATVRFSLGDYLVDTIIYYPDYSLIVWNYEPVVSDSTRLFARVHDAGVWQELPVNVMLEDSSVGLLYEGDLSEFTSHQRSRLDIRISGCDRSGNTIAHTWEPAVMVDDPATGTEEFSPVGTSGSLKTYPNPADGTVYLEISNAVPAQVSVRIFDLYGRTVRNFPPWPAGAGTITLQWNGRDDQGITVPGGIYFYQCRTGAKTYTGKIVIRR